MKYEILKDGVVVNTISADPEFMLHNFEPGSYREVVIESAQEQTVVNKHITQLAFMNRFTDAEAVAIDMISRGEQVQAAMLRRFQAKINVAAFIDLARQDTRDGVQYLEQVGLIGTGRALQILDAPIQFSEIPKDVR